MVDGGDLERKYDVTCGVPRCPGEATVYGVKNIREARRELKDAGWTHVEGMGWVCRYHRQSEVEPYATHDEIRA